MVDGAAGGHRLRVVPWAMVWLRVLLCPLIVVVARLGWAGGWLAGIVVLALVDDILDGMLARRWGCDTPGLRLADSIADTVFYLGVAAAVWLRDPEELRANWMLLAVLGGLEAIRYGYDFWKYGKGASYHSYLAKAWGLVMAAAVVAVLATGGAKGLLGFSLGIGILANLEGLAMSAMLPEWRNDVKTLWAASRLRGVMKAEAATQEGAGRATGYS